MEYQKTLVSRYGFIMLWLFLVGSAQAADYYVDVSNQTGYTIIYLYVSPGDAQSWEEDVLGSDVLQSGTTQRVNLYGYNSPIFDIRLVDEDGDTYTFWNVNVATQDLLVTPGDID